MALMVVTQFKRLQALQKTLSVVFAQVQRLLGVRGKVKIKEGQG